MQTILFIKGMIIFISSEKRYSLFFLHTFCDLYVCRGNANFYQPRSHLGYLQ